MDHPYYTISVASRERGWAYTAVEDRLDLIDPGEDPLLDDPVYLISPFNYTWAFSDELIPGQMEPASATVNFIARDADDIPEVEIGDFLEIDLRIGTTGPRIIAPSPMRVVSAEVELSKSTRAARLHIGVVSIATDLQGLSPQILRDSGLARKRWRARLAEVSNTIGRSLGCPTWWADDEHPLPGIGSGAPENGLSAPKTRWSGNARDIITQLLNSHQPDGYTHSVVPYFDVGFPTGYRRVGPDVYWGDNSGNVTGVVTEPDTDQKFLLVPASRRTASTEQPMTLGIVDGFLSIVPNVTTPGGTARFALDAKWCDLPTSARRSRDHTVNLIHLTGETPIDPEGDSTYERTEGFEDYTSADVVNGVMRRELPTQLELLAIPPGGTYFPEEPAVVAAIYLSDTSTRAAPWSYDGVQLTSSRIPQDLAELVLPQVAPRIPGEPDADGCIVRHVTIYSVKPKLRFDGQPMVGFITGGTLTITGGDIVWQLATTPGLPQWLTTAPVPLTVGEFTDYADDMGIDFDEIYPNLAFSDLDYVGAP